MKRLLPILTFLLSVATLRLKVAQAQPSIPESRGKLVLRLPYHGPDTAPLSNPYRVGLYEADTYQHTGSMLNTDWQGNLYVADPTTPQRCVLRQFDKVGRFRYAWQPLLARNCRLAAVAKDGFVWTGVAESYPGPGGLPIVVYKQGNKKPVLNWRRTLPAALGRQLQQALRSQGLKAKRFWILMSAEATDAQVSLDFSGVPIFPSSLTPATSLNEKSVSLTLLVSSDGKQIKSLNIRDSSEHSESPRLSVGTGFYFTQVDSDLRGKWNNLWVWKQGQTKGQPLLTLSDLANRKTSWQKALQTNNTLLPPLTILDGKNNIYISWTRSASGPMRRFTVAKQSYTLPPRAGFDQDGEKALAVFNSKRQTVALVPWTPSYYETLDNWIVPVPDGSGFYRSEYAERELRIYFHALPQPSPQRTRSNRNRNRRSRSNTR